MTDPAIIILCGIGAAAASVAATMAAASIGFGRVVATADDAIDRWSDLPELPLWMGVDLAAHQPVRMGLDLAPGNDLTGTRASVVVVDEFFQPAERLSKRAARRARGKAIAARRVARRQGL